MMARSGHEHLDQPLGVGRRLRLEQVVAIGDEVGGEKRPGHRMVLHDQDRGGDLVHARKSLQRAKTTPPELLLGPSAANIPHRLQHRFQTVRG